MRPISGMTLHRDTFRYIVNLSRYHAIHTGRNLIMRPSFGHREHHHHHRGRPAFGDPQEAFGPDIGPFGPAQAHGPFPPPPPPQPPFGPWPGMPGFPGFPGGRDMRRGGRRRGHGGGRRSRRGDVRAAILALLAERPMHGYEM